MTAPETEPTPESELPGAAAADQLAAEKAKWDAYYRDLPDHVVDAPTAAFHDELIAVVDELLPDGGKLLEAGCGGGNQSLALAETGRFEASLLDFSPEALRYAESQFKKAGVSGRFVQGDAFAPAKSEFDLVFNLGVLEHYDVQQQAAFLRGMASRSRKYVLVLVPNLACYWYWVWRVGKTVRDGWPFGKEVPTVDLEEAFRQAGIRYLGHSFMGAAWTESFISSLPGLPAETAALLHEVHGSGIVPAASRSYLFAALGVVETVERPAPARWLAKPMGYTPSDADAVAAVSDALALRLAADHDKVEWQRRLRQQEAEAQRQQRRQQHQIAELQAHCDLFQGDSERLAGEVESLRAQWKSELKELEDESVRDLQAANARIEVLEGKLTEVCAWAGRLDDHPLQHFVKRATMGVARAVFRVLPIGDKARTRAYSAVADFRRRRHQLAAPVAANDAPKPLGVALPAASVADVYVFAIIDWHFRIQRPQHLARELARRGHRVFFVSPAHVEHQEPGVVVEQVDASLPIYQLRFQVTGAPSIYSQPPSASLRLEIEKGLSHWLHAARSQRCLVLVEHAFWADFAELLPNSDVVYDCMDHHEGFGGVDSGLLLREQHFVEQADLVVTSSSWLEQEIGKKARANVTIRNAGDFEHFSRVPQEVFRDPSGRRVIGYFGAIAEWFDVELVELVAKAFPDCLLLLIGADTVGAGDRLGHLDNVQLLGERGYETLPHYLHGFAVCLLPFRVMPLTLATNPVKVYEYMAAGRPVVGTDLPEMQQFGTHARVAGDHEAFVLAVAAALADEDEAACESRVAFAAANTWQARAAALVAAVDALPWPRVSVVVLCYKNLHLTKVCLESLLEHGDYPNLQLIVVDNASGDGTDEYLRAFGREHPEVKILLNSENLGYSAGSNVGIRVADGDYVVLLNNDTAVTNGWVRTLIRHFRRDPSIGLLGPVTSNIGNEAKVDVRYESLDQMPAAAQTYTLQRAGRTSPMRTLAFFCVVLSRRVIDECGLLCEDYGIGWFEDDDYCRRVEQVGYGIRLAEDVFVHHELSAAIGKIPEGERRTLFDRNRVIYEAKWGPWNPHEYR